MSLLKPVLIKCTFLILCLFCTCNGAAAQYNYRFDQISVDEGLKNSRVVSVIQDKEGFMWLATHNGLDKFNGADIMHYSLSSPDGLYPNDDIINCLVTSDKYDILCGTKNGNLYAYNRKADAFYKVLPFEHNDALFNIYAILSEDDESIWIGTTGGLYHFNIETSELSAIKQVSQAVNDISLCDDKHIWVGTVNGLHLINKSSKEMVGLSSDRQLNQLLSKIDIMCLHQEEDTLFMGSRNSEIFKFEIHQNQLQLTARKNLSNNEKNYPVTDIISTPDKNHLAIALDGIGLYITDKQLAVKESYFADDNNINSLSSNGVYKLYYSPDDILWVATYGGGINIANPNKKQFSVLKHIPHIHNSLRNNVVNAVLEHDKQLWFGTKTGISIYTPEKNKWKHIPALKKTLQKPFHVMSMCKSKNDAIWVATYGRGLIKIEPSNGRKRVITKSSTGPFTTQTNHLYQVICDSQSRIWTGGIWGNISIIDEKAQTTQTVNISNVRSICEYKNKVLVGTLFGLFMVDKATLEVSRPSQSLLLKSRIICIRKHPSKDKVFLGTDVNGLLEWDMANDELKTYENNNLPSGYIRSILWDQQERLWVSSTGGLSVLNDSTHLFDNYNSSDGLANTEFSENAACLHSSGRLIYGGSKGISWFHPDNITKSEQVSTPLLMSMSLFGQKVEIDPDGVLTENINSQQVLKLQHDQNSLSFEFGTICYTNPQNVRYKWKLEGFEEQWNGPTAVREAIYSKLPHGDYTLKVMVTNDDGVWQNQVKTIQISIAPPFWKTPVAYVLYALVLLGLILLNMHYYHIIIQERHASEKQQFFISIAHDLRTPLSLIKLPIEKMVEAGGKDEAEDRNLNLVKRNVDRLTNLVNQLLDFQKADLQKMQLQVEKTHLNQFITERLESFTPLASEKQIKVKTALAEHGEDIWIDRSKMEKVMFNLFSNAFKYTPAGGTIKISTEYTAKYATIHVQDSGEGIPANQQKNIFQRYYRATNAINSKEVGSGVGLMLSKQLVELHKGKISFKSEYGMGSTFTVKLPLGKKLFTPDETRHFDAEESALTPIYSRTADTLNSNSSGPKLLLVEDNPELLDSLAIEFDTQYRVLKAADGEEGMKLATEHMPDIIVSDVMMPKMNGHQLCMKLKNDLSTCHIPIVLLTALDSPDYKREGLEHGADAYLEKPFDIKLLRAQISNLLKNRQRLKQTFREPSSQIEEASTNQTDQAFLEKIKQHIITHIDSEKLSVEQTAQALGMSRPVLYRKIKSLTDLSPQQFLMTIKLKEAARIMKEDGHNISETAYMIGFTDPKYFSQTFKKYFGVTPSQYLKK
ncbi:MULTISPECIES: ATP-binding protein [unclassified Carboxylicivirga]|uniref:hybrid sensor histidine kinase/response regulator transcription factor n=1 Tax=Carboxylicivirga TaxID=1628153 RepID=UPI003D33E2BB